MTDGHGGYRWAHLSDDELTVRLTAAGCPAMVLPDLVRQRDDDDDMAALIEQFLNKEDM